MSQISDLVNLAKSENSNSGKEINFGKVPNFQGQQILKNTAVKINGAKKILSTFAINHILKQHGQGTNQEKRGQKTIVDADFEFIPKILEDPDKVEKAVSNNRGHTALKFYKEINGFNYCIIAAIHNSGDGLNLNVDTMFAKK